MWDAQQRGESQESLEVAWAVRPRYALCHGHPGHAFHGQDAHAMFSEGKRRRSVLRKTRQGHHPNAGTRTLLRIFHYIVVRLLRLIQLDSRVQAIHQRLAVLVLGEVQSLLRG